MYGNRFVLIRSEKKTLDEMERLEREASEAADRAASEANAQIAPAVTAAQEARDQAQDARDDAEAAAGTAAAAALAPVQVLRVGRLAYGRDASGTALATEDGQKWSPVGNVTPNHWGAAADGATDDTAAINSAIAWWKSRLSTILNSSGDQIALPLRFEFLPGEYAVTSLNFTNIKNTRMRTIEGNGAIIKGIANGKAVIDALSSRWLSFHNITVMNAPGITPFSGIQMGPMGGEANGNCSFFNVTVWGTWELAPYHNSGCETTIHVGCQFIQNNPGLSRYAAVLDGQTVKALPRSDYVTVTRTLNNPVSYTCNGFYGCQFRNEADGPAVFLSRPTNHVYDRSCYFLAFNGACVDIWLAADAPFLGSTLSGHFESQLESPIVPEAIGVQYAIRFIGNSSTGAIRGLTMETSMPHCEVAVFGATSVINFRSADITISGMTMPNAKLFDVPNQSIFSGKIRVQGSDTVNIDTLASFSGEVHIDSGSVPALPSSMVGHIYLPGTVKSYVGNVVQNITSHEAGAITVTSEYVAMAFPTATTITDIIDGDVSSAPKRVSLRVGNTRSVTLVHNTSKLRLNGGVDRVLLPNEGITLMRVNATLWQEV